MNFKSKSIYGINIVFLLDSNIAHPENSIFLGLFSGNDAKGMNFNDNSNVNLKVLEVPALGLSVILEGSRLRIEDRFLKSPEESNLIETAVNIFNKLFPGKEIVGYGFNFDIYYQLQDVIRISDTFSSINPTGIKDGESLINLGWQWTIAEKDGKGFKGYFLKVTAPIEIAVHHNLHHNGKKNPEIETLKKEFENAFTETHKHISAFVL